ncbi:MAG: hypothetical protein EA415_12660 [Sphaerobacteraceae bacterium]|nr:MAG: hypothetical protein EA415_12660 [Sphaerobacteraceae bacterium]
MDDLQLLKTYEPIVRFTYGELFFPMSIEPYVKQCSLWVRPPRGESKQVVRPGKLELETLVEHGTADPDHTLYLRFVQHPLDSFDYQRWARRPGRPNFQAPGRLARVGLPARLTDSLFFLSLLLRGSVPGGTAAAASMNYESIRRQDPNYYYYGRVVHRAGYIVLQYLYFYAMNDWRSTFYGANDHEADWEQVLVYLEERGDEPPEPVWLAYASHNHKGDDLRRRWDDPEIEREGTHPIVYAGAGSHASYFERGEYLTPVELAFMTPVLRAVHTLEGIWRDRLGQGDPEKLVGRIESFFGVPFIDYARGDGLAIGAGQDVEWTPVVIDDSVEWVDNYRGLWGLDARDPFAGESAPGGPKYNRDGTIRQSWYDPLGWAGLNKVATPYQSAQVMERHIDELRGDLNLVQLQIDQLRSTLPRMELESKALKQGHQWSQMDERRTEELRAEADRLNELQRRRVDLTEKLQACREFLERLRQGDMGDPQSHIAHKFTPQSEQELRQSRLAEAWAAGSVGLLMLGIVAMVGLGVAGWTVTLAFIAGMVIVIESILRQKVVKLLVNVSIILALITGLILLYEFFWWTVVVVTVAVAMLIITDNIRELWHR